jgi:hypothetical protein
MRPRKSTDIALLTVIQECNMSQSDNARLLHLLQISVDLRDQMAEVHRLRNSLQLAETARRSKRPTDARVVSDHDRRA